LAESTLGRRAAAGCHCPCDGERSCSHPGRRTDRLIG
jgi:hypothetical protein